MYTILISGILGFIIVLIISCYNSIKEKEYDITWILGYIMGAFIGLLLGFMISLFLSVKLETNKYTYYLETLQDNNDISGSFFLGCGSVDGTMKYTYYYKVDSNSYKMNELYNNSNNITIKYINNIDDNNKPRIEYYRQEKIKPNKILDINNFSLNININRDPDYYVIYVPKGTIKNNTYKLDGK